MELLLVLALLVVMGAIAAPMLTRSLKYQNLKESADLVRGEFGRARALAMASGNEYVFVYQLGSGQYTYLPFDQSSQTAFDPGDAVNHDNFQYGDGWLARGVLFVGSEVADDSRELTLTEDQESGGAAGGQQQIFFYPDGTTQNATIYLQGESNEVMAVHLRGLTGVTAVSSPGSGGTR